MSGTTFVAIPGKTTVRLFSSKKEEDADEFVLRLVQEKKIESVYIDAPLSLPGVYSGLKDRSDYFYRVCDKELHTMSPMFLGTLTARAMKLANTLMKAGTECMEVNPAAFAEKLGLKKRGYKDQLEALPELTEQVVAVLNLPLSYELSSWKELDAFLALATGSLHQQGKASFSGVKEEGLIYY